jgi:hypothetical protein
VRHHSMHIHSCRVELRSAYMTVLCLRTDEGWFNLATQQGEQVLMEAEMHTETAAPASLPPEHEPKHDYHADVVAFTGEPFAFAVAPPRCLEILISHRARRLGDIVPSTESQEVQSRSGGGATSPQASNTGGG